MKGICLMLWMIFTLILVFSIIGLVLFIPKDIYSYAESTPSTWMHIGRRLLESVIS